MKKLFLLLAFFAFSTFVNAQTETAKQDPPKMAKKEVVAKPKQVANPAAFACMKCFNIEKAEGKCSICQADKVQLGTYFCAHCQKGTGAKLGKCDMCQAQTTQMTRKFCGSKTGKSDKKEMPKKAA